MKYKKKKVIKYRGSKTHGGGAMKKRRGAGNRGGRGRAGSGKKGDAKKPSYWKEIKTKQKSKKGFSSKNRVLVKAVNLWVIHESLNSWLEKGVAVKKPTGYEIELKKLGYNKLLGAGFIKEKLIIITDFASKKAIDKVKKAGGEVKGLHQKKLKPKKEVKKKAPEVEAIDEAPEKVPKEAKAEAKKEPAKPEPAKQEAGSKNKEPELKEN